MIIAQGGSIGGWSLYAKDGKPKYCYNLLGVQRFYVEGTQAIPEGQHQVRMEFAYDGGGLGKGGDVVLFLDGEKVGQGRVGATAAMVFSADDTCDIGVEGGAVVSEDYGPRGNEFTGEVNWVPDRPRRSSRGPRPPDHPGGAAPRRHGQAVTVGRSHPKRMMTATRFGATVPSREQLGRRFRPSE